MADDDVQLTDLEVIAQFSLAVRGATASRADVLAALEADLDYLTGGRRPVTVAKTSAPVVRATVKPAPRVAAAASKATKATKAPVKKATRGRSA